LGITRQEIYPVCVITLTTWLIMGNRKKAPEGGQKIKRKSRLYI
jgi:hypothetical protein